MTTRKTHDADLCERIRVLEERVAELEAQPHTTYITQPPHWCYSGCPIHYPTITWAPHWSTDTTITYDSTTIVPHDIYSGTHQQ